MGWNDRLPDPDAWESHVESLLDRADDLRKRRKENPERFDGPPVSPTEFDKLTEGEAA